MIPQFNSRVRWTMVAIVVSASGATASAGDLAQPGPFSAGTRTVTVARTTPGAGSFSARLYYPALIAGADAPADPAGAPYPAISFGHGFLQQVAQYQSTLTHLATHGYIAIAPESHTGFAPNHAQFAQDLRDSLTHLELINGQGGGPLFGLVEVNAFGLAGHSMGGGCSILASATEGPRLRAIAPLAPAETSVSAIGAMPMIDVPIALIVGTQDTIVPTGSHGQPMYTSGLAPRQLVSIAGGFHCGFTDAGFLFCDSGSISRAQQLAITRRLLTSWFNLHLKGDQAEWPSWWGPEAAPTPALGRSADAGLSLELTDPCPIVRHAGAAATIPIRLRNTGGRVASAELFAEGALFGVAGAEPAAVGPLLPDESADGALTLTTDNNDAGIERVLVSARSSADGATRAWTLVQVHFICAGDADRDGAVGLADLAMIITGWGGTGCPAAMGDVTNDGAVGLDDLAQVIVNWARACPPSPPAQGAR